MPLFPPGFRRALAAAISCGLLLTGCTIQTPGPLPSPSATPTKARPFTVLTAERVTTTDPAAVTTDVGAIVALNLYQRLMLVQPGESLLKPDAAAECLFTGATTYECALPKDRRFSNGHELTASDVKFSILRALRLAPPGTSISMLNALDRIETPDAYTVRFRLMWPDSQFGYGLATPVASIVDEESYDADAFKPVSDMPMGSGPYQLDVLDQKGFTISRFQNYHGPLGTDMPKIRVSYADSDAAEAALTDGAAEMVWRTLQPAAAQRVDARIQASMTGTTQFGFRRWWLPGVGMRRLIWNPKSRFRSDATLRQVIARALQSDRTATSLVPAILPGHLDAFPAGGKPRIPKLTPRRVTLTLSYTSTAPGMADLARLIQERVEDAAAVSILVTPDSGQADLTLTDQNVWVNTAFGWLQEYLQHPLPGSAGKLEVLVERARKTNDADVRIPALGEIQKQAAADATVIPISQAEGILFVGRRVDLVGEAFGPGWQLGLWGARWVN